MKKIITGIAVILLLLGAYIFFTNETESTYYDVDLSQMRETTGAPRELISYETEVDGPEECSSFEQYDADAGVCYFECATEQECADIQSGIDDELAGWADEESKDQSPMSEEVSGDASTLASYAVSSGEKIRLESGTDAQEYKTLWSEISQLSPDNISNSYIETYEVYDDAQSDTLAFVDDEDQNGKWRIAVNLAGRRDSSEREQKATIIHELSHIITLNTSQVKPNFTTCNTYELPEGCTNSNSYINTFYTAYWKGVSSPAQYDSNKFVTEYAATEPVEDLAETFAFFVLERDKEELGNQIKYQKIKMLYNYPELVQIRKDMRNELAKDIVRARKQQTN